VSADDSKLPLLILRVTLRSFTVGLLCWAKLKCFDQTFDHRMLMFIRVRGDSGMACEMVRTRLFGSNLACKYDSFIERYKDKFAFALITNG